MKKIVSLILCMLIALFALTSCAGKSVGASAGNNSKQYKFACVPGGLNPYFDPMPGAANDAAKDQKIANVTVQSPQQWDQNEQNVILDGLVAKGYTGIFMMPSNAVSANAEITKIVARGIPVVCVGGAPQLPSKATLTLATDVYKSAYNETKTAIKAMNGKGNLVGLTGQITDPNTQKRINGIKAAVNETNGSVKLIQVIGDIDEAEAANKAVDNLFAAKSSEINGIVCTAYYPGVAVATELKQLNNKNIIAIGQDTDDVVMQAIKDGYMYGTMSQNPYGQAYIATVTLKMLKDGYTYKSSSPAVIDSGSFFISKDNIDQYDNLLKEETNSILKTWKSYFNAPSK